jgi:hypothetical protein
VDCIWAHAYPCWVTQRSGSNEPLLLTNAPQKSIKHSLQTILGKVAPLGSLASVPRLTDLSCWFIAECLGRSRHSLGGFLVRVLPVKWWAKAQPTRALASLVNRRGRRSHTGLSFLASCLHLYLRNRQGATAPCSLFVTLSSCLVRLLFVLPPVGAYALFLTDLTDRIGQH